MKATTKTERLTHDVLAACGMISERAAATFEADELPAGHDARLKLFYREVREAAALAAAKADDAIAATLFAWLAHHHDIGAGTIFAGLAARAAFGYRHRNL